MAAHRSRSPFVVQQSRLLISRVFPNAGPSAFDFLGGDIGGAILALGLGSLNS